MIINNTNAQFRFSSIRYDVVEGDIGANEELRYLYIDEVSTLDYGATRAVVVVERKLHFEPFFLYELAVSLEFVLEYDEILLDNVDADLIRTEILEQIQKSSGFERLSSLIANISSAQGNTPIITNSFLTQSL